MSSWFKEEPGLPSIRHTQPLSPPHNRPQDHPDPVQKLSGIRTEFLTPPTSFLLSMSHPLCLRLVSSLFPVLLSPVLLPPSVLSRSRCGFFFSLLSLPVSLFSSPRFPSSVSCYNSCSTLQFVSTLFFQLYFLSPVSIPLS